MDAVSEIRGRLSIEDVVAEYVVLKRAGRNFKGLSPFTNEKSPSLIVSPEKQIWKDFSSGKGGSIFDFIMEAEGVEFKDALEILARKAGLNLDEYKTSQGRKGPDKTRLLKILELSTKFYQVQLKNNPKALSYLIRKRQFSKETILAWKLGYSPNSSHALLDFLKSKEFSINEMKQAGVISVYRGQSQDMFRGRIMIPLSDAQGSVIGFTARVLDSASSQAKYINTPSTVLYDKSHNVFGLDKAKESIRKNNYAVIVEGNLDVISSHQAGVTEVVATAGTAVTESQLKALTRFTGDIRLSLDNDRAGIAATERVIPIASKVNATLSIINITEGKDPDELIKIDPNLWKEAVKKNSYALDWLIDQTKSSLDITSADGKRKFSDKILPVVKSLSDSVEKDHYLGQIAQLINVDKSSLMSKMQNSSTFTAPSYKVKKIKTENEKMDKPTIDRIRHQDRLLALALVRSTLRQTLDLIEEDMFDLSSAKELLKILKASPAADWNEILNDISSQNLQDYVKIESVLYEELYSGLEMNDLFDEAMRSRTEVVGRYVKKLKNENSDKISQINSEAEVRKFQETDKKLNDLLSKVQTRR